MYLSHQVSFSVLATDILVIVFSEVRWWESCNLQLYCVLDRPAEGLGFRSASYFPFKVLRLLKYSHYTNLSSFLSPSPSSARLVLVFYSEYFIGGIIVMSIFKSSSRERWISFSAYYVFFSMSWVYLSTYNIQRSSQISFHRPFSDALFEVCRHVSLYLNLAAEWNGF